MTLQSNGSLISRRVRGIGTAAGRCISVTNSLASIADFAILCTQMNHNDNSEYLLKLRKVVNFMHTFNDLLNNTLFVLIAALVI